MTTIDSSDTADRIDGRFSAGLARSEAEVEASQGLRYRVFATEMGATLHTTHPGQDRDAFDPYCRHLVVRDNIKQQIVASTRILEGWQASRAGGFYCVGEFRMDAIESLPGRKLELGRTCVDPAYRGGPALALLWSAIARFVRHHRYDYLIGCASLPARDHGLGAMAIMRELRARHMAPEALRVEPRTPVPSLVGRPPAPAELPPLIRTYLALGAQVCGEPCLDPDARIADLFLLLDLRHLESHYARRFRHLGNRRPVAA